MCKLSLKKKTAENGSRVKDKKLSPIVRKKSSHYKYTNSSTLLHKTQARLLLI